MGKRYILYRMLAMQGKSFIDFDGVFACDSVAKAKQIAQNTYTQLQRRLGGKIKLTLVNIDTYRTVANFPKR